MSTAAWRVINITGKFIRAGDSFDRKRITNRQCNEIQERYMINESPREFAGTYILADINDTARRGSHASIPQFFDQQRAESSAMNPTPLTKRECHCDVHHAHHQDIVYEVLAAAVICLPMSNRRFILISAEN